MVNRKVLPLLIAALCCNKLVYGVEVYLFKSQKYVGDNDQLQGVANAITRKFHSHGIKANMIATYESSIKVTPNSISLFSSVEGINKWNNIKKQPNNTFSVFLTHQWWSDLLQILPDKPSLNLIAAPQYTITPAVNKSLAKYGIPVLGINGVCSSLQKEDLIKAYANSSIPKNTSYTLVLLAGDTQDVNGKWKLYSTKEADRLARIVTKHYIKTGNTILITNGPRTGKIDPVSGKETNAHRNETLDKVSQAFLAELKHTIPPAKILFYNFQYDMPSILSASMGAVLMNKGSYFYVPGESISTASQAISLLPPNSIILYKHNAMLDLHEKYTAEELKLGCASVIDSQGKKSKPTVTPDKKCLINQCDDVAQHIYELYFNKLTENIL